MHRSKRDVRETLAWFRPHGLDGLKFVELTERVEQIIEKTDVSIRGPDGTGEPIVTSTVIELNGDLKLGQKGMAFSFPRIIPEYGMIQMDDANLYFDLVGTDFLPYRDVVIDILTAAKEIFGDDLDVLDSLGNMEKHVCLPDALKSEHSQPALV